MVLESGDIKKNKLDIEKAYDHVEWSFLLPVMKKMGFGEKWLRWIKWCLSATSFFVLINGTLSGFFQSSRSLRQRDPLSPYLFVIAIEALSFLLKREVCGGFLSSCQLRGKGDEVVKVSHLLFVDDTLIFCEVWEEQMMFLWWLLMWFEAISGLRVNMDKSELILVGRVENVEDLVAEIGCKVGSLLFTYLGMPLGALFKSVVVWDGIEERFYKRLAMWKRQYISKAGGITLIQNIFSSLPIYFMSILHLPRVVRMRLK